MADSGVMGESKNRGEDSLPITGGSASKRPSLGGISSLYRTTALEALRQWFLLLVLLQLSLLDGVLVPGREDMKFEQVLLEIS